MNNASNESKVILNGNTKYRIVLSFDKLPSNCGECPLYNNSKESYEDMVSVGYYHRCPFKCNSVGCLVERPKDCPIKEV